MKAERFVAGFDSASSMFKALAAYLHRREFQGMAPPIEPLGRFVNALPRAVREQIYIWGGALEAVSPDQLGEFRAEAAAEWIAGLYPKRHYPAVMIGSSNGAGVHLGAALGAPWLPQTLFIPVRRDGLDVDDMKGEMAWGREPGRRLLEANPELQLHHMHDPNQDRLMVQRMTYFRVKRRRLGEAFERFVRERLAPGGTILLVECERTWPTVEVGERHYFQPGAMGGLEPEEYLHGSPKVADLLERYEADGRAWAPPRPDAERPEAEWGFEPALRGDVARVAAEGGYRLCRLVFTEPEDLSPVAADLYRGWYEERGMPAGRLLLEMFMMIEPYWALRTGPVPLWTLFSVEPSAKMAEAYIDERPAFADIYALLFSHGTESAGLATAERWRQVIDRARERGELIGADPERFPLDIGVYGIFHPRLKATIPARYPLPGYVTVDRVARFVAEGDRYRVRWIEEDAAALARGEESGATAPNRVAEVSAGQAGGARGGSRVIAS